MPSRALLSLEYSIREIGHLERADPSVAGALMSQPEITRSVGRAAVVLLYSHFERYLYAVNEEATSFVNSASVAGDCLPEKLRLIHSKAALDRLALTQWDKRSGGLTGFVSTDSWLWGAGMSGQLEHGRILAWMKSVTPKRLVRYYKYWDVDEIFKAITRAEHTRRDLWLQIQALVDKRNNIAHGDATTEATPREVRLYLEAVLVFCTRADRKMASQIRRLCVAGSPW